MEVLLTDLTTSTVNGTGVFDALMRTNGVHLEQEFQKGRIKGPEYAQVYLGSLQSSMQFAIQFLLERQKADQEAQLLAEQVKTQQLQQKLIIQQTLNAETENVVMQKQICKLQAEYDLIMEQKLKTVAETALLTQKKATEKAQVSGVGIDQDSVIGKQISLYHAQAEGFKRDAEQKAAKLMVDSWNVRRTTDEGTVADSTNMLSDHNIGRTISKLLAGVGA